MMDKYSKIDEFATAYVAIWACAFPFLAIGAYFAGEYARLKEEHDALVLKNSQKTEIINYDSTQTSVYDSTGASDSTNISDKFVMMKSSLEVKVYMDEK